MGVDSDRFVRPPFFSLSPISLSKLKHPPLLVSTMSWTKTKKEEESFSSPLQRRQRRAVGFELEPNDDINNYDDGQTPSTTPNIGDVVLLSNNVDVDEEVLNSGHIFSRLIDGRFSNNHDSNENDDDDDSSDDDEFYEEIASYTNINNNNNSAATANDDDTKNNDATSDNKALLLSFVLLVIIGTGNKIFQKLQAIPMYNYPNSLNLITTFMYIPLCFAYILPMSSSKQHHGGGCCFNNNTATAAAIPTETTKTSWKIMSKVPFLIMGILDACASILYTFAAVYLPGSVLLLLPQAAIPISMILSYYIKGERYDVHQYIGALVVIIGILIVLLLEPMIIISGGGGGGGRHNTYDPEYKCIAYNNMDTYCVLCEEELTMEGCISHFTSNGSGSNTHNNAASSSGSSSNLDNDEEDYNDYAWTSQLWTAVGTPAAYAYGDVMLRSLIGSNSSGSGSGDNNKHNDEICQWIHTDDPTSSLSSSLSSETSSSTTSLLFWSSMAIVACIPMCLSSIYKELTLNGGVGNSSDGRGRGGGGIDPIFLNGWVAVFQFLFSILLSLPAGMSSNPPITLTEWPANIIDGIKCYFGTPTITTGCHPDDHCSESPIYVNIFLFFNVGFNIVLAYILKYGSANISFMASALILPLGNLVFTLPFVPGSMPLKDSDIAGLVVLLFGLYVYRFGNTNQCCTTKTRRTIMKYLPWRRRRGGSGRRANPVLSMAMTEDQFEWDAPVYRNDSSTTRSALLREPLLLTPIR